MTIQTQRWKSPEYSKKEINKAGTMIRDTDILEPEKAHALEVIDNWRASHAYPLHVLYMHLRKMRGSRNDIIVAERLKRLDSIVAKLGREEKMELYRMQDIGGCRFIVPTIDEVYFYAEKLKKSRVRHEFKREYDYIKQPKSSGYRSLHIVYKYHSDIKDTYNKNMLIEIQFRTHLQHLWATALETMGIFTHQALKAGKGDDELKRFFVLISALFAIIENAANVPNTGNRKEIIDEIREINYKHNYMNMLRAFRVAIEHESDSINDKNGYYVLRLNYNTRMLRIQYFMPSQIEEANEQYIKSETEKGDEQVDAVLVRADSFATLQAAYPNYFADIGQFIEIVNDNIF